MPQTDIDVLKEALQCHWPGKPGDKARGYVGRFFNGTRLGTKITAQVVGNHGTYTVSIRADEQELTSACSCYIGKHGYCHHCTALAVTFLNDPASFREIKTKPLAAVKELAELPEYLQSVTLDGLLQELKAHSITQKAFAEGIGMNSRHLSAVKSSEFRNHFYHELGQRNWLVCGCWSVSARPTRRVRTGEPPGCCHYRAVCIQNRWKG